jgi:RNA polymerase sigma-70 factor (ECF subfamily)
MSDNRAVPPLRVSTVADDADRAVLSRIAHGELHALDELYDRYKTMAYSIAYRITNDAALAEDVVQDAFLGAWRNAARYVEGRGSVKTWLLAIVHHRAIDAVRRRRPTAELPEREAVPPAALTLPDVWGEVVAILDAEAVRGALAVLSEVQREALELAYYGGLTQQEIAERTSTPLGTVKSRMRLGLLAMRRVLGGDDGTPMDAATPGDEGMSGTPTSGQEADAP